MQQSINNNKSKANILLAAIFVLFASATALKYLFRSSFFAGLLAFTAEAALVGGIADWFAVTALFKKPLGFSWHTAIIPNNRDQIIKSISELVSNELLSVETVSSKIASLGLVDIIADGFPDIVGNLSLENRFQDMIGNNVDEPDIARLAATIDHFIKDGLKKEGISDEIRSLLIKAVEEGKHKVWLSNLFKKAIKIAKKDSTREKIYKLLKTQENYNDSNTGAGSFFFRILLNISRNSKHSNLFNIAELLQRELIEVLEELNDPSSPVFVKLAENFASLLEHLDEDQALLDLLQTWKNGVLEHLGLLEALQQLLASAVDSEIRRQEAVQWLADNIGHYLTRLKNDENIKNSTEEILKTIIQKVLVSEHHLIGEITKETLDAFSNEKLIQLINDTVGDDLQWIRINGSIVGAAAGILIYLFTHLLYVPFLLPLIRTLLGLGL